jgi:hypothetical protein
MYSTPARWIAPTFDDIYLKPPIRQTGVGGQPAAIAQPREGCATGLSVSDSRFQAMFVLTTGLSATERRQIAFASVFPRSSSSALPLAR